MDLNNELRHLTFEQIVQLGAIANNRIQQEQARQQTQSSAPFPGNYPMVPPSPQIGTSVHGHVMHQGHFQGDWNPEWGGSAASSQPIRVDSPPPNVTTAPIDIEETSSPLKPQAPMNNGKNDKKKGKEVVSEGQGKRTKQDNYQVLEDRLLVTSYLEISEDPMTNTGQTLACFWAKVTALYNSKRGSYALRTKRSLQSRYDTVRKDVAKFSSYFADVVRRNTSGMSDADKTAVACTEFAACEPGHKPFKFLHCWEIMKDNPKFQDTKHGRNYRSTHSVSYQDQLLSPEAQDVGAGDTSGTPTSIASKRPMGRDAAKRANKKQNSGTVSTGDSEFANSMHDLVLTRFADNDTSRKTFLDWKKEDKLDARNDRKVMIEIKKEKLELEKHKLAMKEMFEKERLELEKQKIAQKQKEEDERILGMKLDQLEEPRRTYYAAWQKEIMARVTPSNHK